MENREKTDNRDRILEKARDLFMRYGIKSITMDEIAGQLGISKKTIYQFFTDKDEMVEAVVNEEMNNNEADCVEGVKRSDNAIHEIFIAMEGIQEMMKTMNPQLMYDLEKHHPAAYRRIRQHKYQFMYEMIKQNLQRGIKEDIYRAEINADFTSRYRIESAFMTFNQEAFPWNKYPMNQTCHELALLFLHSICNPKGKKLIDKYLNEEQKIAQ